eukprot:SAG31_NODE_12331_length_949_cov_1.215294_1_plen_124_part_10
MDRRSVNGRELFGGAHFIGDLLELLQQLGGAGIPRLVEQRDLALDLVLKLSRHRCINNLSIDTDVTRFGCKAQRSGQRYISGKRCGAPQTETKANESFKAAERFRDWSVPEYIYCFPVSSAGHR